MVGATVSVTVLMLIAAVHFYWAMGGRAGKSAAIPRRHGEPVLRPGAPATALVGCALLVSAAIVATQAGLIFPGQFQPYPRIATGLLAMIFLARAVGDFRYVGFFKAIGGSRFAQLDTRIFSPLCLLLALAIADATFALQDRCAE